MAESADQASDVATLPSSASTIDVEEGLDLPIVLPLIVLLASWELLLLRALQISPTRGINSAASASLRIFESIGFFAQNLTALLAIFACGSLLIALLRNLNIGPIVHRLTIGGFGVIVLAVCTASTFFAVGPQTTLMAHAASVLMSILLVVGLFWARRNMSLLVGALLVLLPTVLRFYASCAISFSALRTESSLPLSAFHAAEVVAVVAALSAPFLFAGIRLRSLIERPPVLAIGVAVLPAMTLAAAMIGNEEQVQTMTRSAVGIYLSVPLASVVYPLALFFYVFAIATLILPSPSGTETRRARRIGYGLALLFLAGLDNLEGAVMGLGMGSGDVADLIQYLLDGNWSNLHGEQQLLVGPPLRHLYQVLLMTLGYLVLARGLYGGSKGNPSSESTEGEA